MEAFADSDRFAELGGTPKARLAQFINGSISPDTRFSLVVILHSDFWDWYYSTWDVVHALMFCGL